MRNMRNTIATFLLSSTFACSLTFSGLNLHTAQAQGNGATAGATTNASPSANADPYPYCQLLAVPSEVDSNANQTAARQSSPSAPAQQAGSGSVPANSAGGIRAPVVPDITELLESTTDVNKIVDTILGSAAPIPSSGYEPLFQALALQIEDKYIDVSQLSSIASFASRHQNIDTREQFDQSVYALVQSLDDPAASYLSAPDNLALNLRGSIQNIAFFGAMLTAGKNGSFVIDSLVPGSTADLNGFRVGDTILSIEGQSLKGMKLTDAEALEMSADGNQLKVTSTQDNSQVDRTYMLQAAVSYNPGVQLLPQNVAYIKMPIQFGDDDVSALVQDVVKQQATTPGGMAGIVLDLRYVNSASVESISELLPYLISHDVTIHDQSRQGQSTIDLPETISPAQNSPGASYPPEVLQLLSELQTIPLVVLVNGSTTSAVAGVLTEALKDGHSGTTIVGDATHVSSREVSSVELPNCGILTLPAASFEVTNTDSTITGGSLSNEPDIGKGTTAGGITPDVIVSPPRDRASLGDIQLGRAVQLVVKQSMFRPANLVLTDSPHIARLGPPPAIPRDDLDTRRIAAERKTLLIQGLAFIAATMLALLYWLLSADKATFLHRNKGQSKPPCAFIRARLFKSSRRDPAALSTTEKTMIKIKGGFTLHPIVRGTLGVAFLIASLSGLYYCAQKEGGIVMPTSQALSYLTSSNAKKLIHFNTSKDLATAGTEKPVLVVLCPTESCEASSLDLATVTADFKGKVTVLALDPYKQSAFLSTFMQDFVKQQEMRLIILPLAANVLQQSNEALTTDNLTKLLLDPDFKAIVSQTIAQSGLMLPLYPQYFLFTPDNFQLVEAKAGLADKGSIEDFVNAGLPMITQIQTVEAAAATTSAAATTATATTAPPGGTSPASPPSQPGSNQP